MDLVNILTLLAVTFYLGAALSISLKLFDAQGPNPKLYLSLGTFAVLCHCVLLSNNFYFQQQLDFSLINVVSLVAVSISGAVTAISLRYKTNLILPVVYGFSAVLLAILFFLPEKRHLVIDTSTMVLVTHITFALLSYGILVIATLYSFQVNYINFKLKSKNIAAVNHLPPLMQVEGQLFAIMFTGTVCLALSQLIGMMFIDNFFATENVHKTVLSVIALVMYSVILWGHFRLGWRGHRVMILSIIATTVLTLSYFGSRFVKEVLLS
ncbi:cytochrome C assembly family protein [Thalassotalea sp. HSM 43]|uniref:cytochrome C assembly family protein n=1 Tax=Thalassotalea sp. HSM 43 TaxID=2552945 RepID=UPI001081BC05|nr:cytochrome c biogenesis protein CcsA [Thalassotalea sp. HSM 43]QBY05222.1 cytochrome C assembly family protein [Thalassotalea sp. HSM 43]